MSNQILKLTAGQAVGVALSVLPEMSGCTMDECQRKVNGFITHLNNMGFTVSAEVEE